MFLIPYRRTTIHSPAAPGEILDRLHQVTTKSRLSYGKFEFVGEVSESEFRIHRFIDGANSYLPVIRGRIQPSGTGSEITLVQTPHRTVIILIPVIFVLMPFILAGPTREFFIWLAVLTAFHCGMYFFCFLPEVSKAEARIRQIAIGNEESGATTQPAPST